MYDIVAKRKVKKKIEFYVAQYKDLSEKLNRLVIKPREACSAHQLHGKLQGKWACWLRSNIRLVYTIDDKNQLIIVYAIGTHKEY